MAEKPSFPGMFLLVDHGECVGSTMNHGKVRRGLLEGVSRAMYIYQSESLIIPPKYTPGGKEKVQPLRAVVVLIKSRFGPYRTILP